jgi:hypothetical protein
MSTFGDPIYGADAALMRIASYAPVLVSVLIWPYGRTVTGRYASGSGRSNQAFKTWLNGREESWRDGVEAVATGFTGFTTASTEALPDAVAVMEPLPCRPPGR